MRNQERSISGNGVDRVPSRATTPLNGGSAWPPPWLAAAMANSPKDAVSQAAEPAPAAPPATSPKATSATGQAPAKTAGLMCRKCGSSDVVEVPIHNGESTRVDCAKCSRFIAFAVWYGHLLTPSQN